jgi:hypothetical protein
MSIQLLVNFQRLRTVALVPVDSRVAAALDIINGEYDSVERVYDGNIDISADLATVIYEAWASRPYDEMGECAFEYVCHYRPDVAPELHRARAMQQAA